MKIPKRTATTLRILLFLSISSFLVPDLKKAIEFYKDSYFPWIFLTLLSVLGVAALFYKDRVSKETKARHAYTGLIILSLISAMVFFWSVKFSVDLLKLFYSLRSVSEHKAPFYILLIPMFYLGMTIYLWIHVARRRRNN